MLNQLSILRVDASARSDGSVSRQLGDEVIQALSAGNELTVLTRDLANAAPGFVDSDWIAANTTPTNQRNEKQKADLSLSDQLVSELMSADVLLITTPIYNFSVPASLKAWIDMIARAGLTFRYTENGPVGLLENKRAIVTLASGGTSVDSPIDFATPFLRHIMGFIGIHQVDVIAADALARDAQHTIKAASDNIVSLSNNFHRIND
jgi:FMN-dependent NADH-azoreductase